MRLLAPAKINLHLRVGRRRADGFHPLLSWMTTVGLFDNLELERTAHGGVELTTDRPDLPGDSKNLVARAAAVLAEEASVSGKNPTDVGDIRTNLLKRIPIGAGLGGGSSDAARTVVGLNRLWQIGLPVDRLIHVAAKLGSDVPFFLKQPSAVCRGRGEIVQPIDLPKPRWALLVLTGIAMRTADVYRKFDEMKPGRAEDVEQSPDWQAWSKLNAIDLLPRLTNDLETPAFALQPDLARLRSESEQTIGRPVRMSGSGGSLFTLADHEKDARSMAEKLSSIHRVEAVVAPVGPKIEDDLLER